MTRFFSIFLTCVLVLSLAACAGGGGGTPAPAANNPPAANNTAPAVVDEGISGSVRVLLAGYDLEDTVDAATGASREGLINFWNRTFTPRYPNIEVELLTVPWGEAQQTQQVELASGSIDVMYVGGYGVQFYEQGLTRQLNDLIDNDPSFDPSIYPQGLWNSNINLITADGVRIGLPAVMGQRFTIYDKKLFDDWGVEYLSEYPTTQEILEKAAKMTGINPVTGEQNYGVYFNPSFPLARFTFDAWSYAFKATGGTGFPSNPREIKWALNSPEMYNLFEAYGELATYCHPGFVTSTGAEKWGTTDNDIAIYLDTNGGALVTEARATGDTSLIERFTGAYNVGPNGEGWVACDPMVMSSRTQNPEAAWEVIKHLAGYERQEYYYVNFLATPVLATPRFIDPVDVYTPIALNIASHAQTTLIDSANPFYVSEIVPVVTKFHTDRAGGAAVDIQALIDDLQKRAEEWSAAQ